MKLHDHNMIQVTRHNLIQEKRVNKYFKLFTPSS